MNRISPVLIAGLLAIVSASAQEWAKARLENSPRHREWVKLRHGTREVNAYIAYPEVKDKATAVVVIHEIFGLTDWVRGVTDQLAEAGYIAIAPDLLSCAAPGGVGTANLGGNDAATKAIRNLPPQQVTEDLAVAVDYIGKLPAANSKVVVGGFCWGGAQTFRFATNNKEVKAAFVFYGTGPENEQDVKRINCPVYGFYGGNDNRVDATIPRTTELMKAAGKTYEPVTYEGAGHGFMRAGEAPDAKEGDKKAREDAWKRWKLLLKKI